MSLVSGSGPHLVMPQATDAAEPGGHWLSCPRLPVHPREADPAGDERQRGQAGGQLIECQGAATFLAAEHQLITMAGDMLPGLAGQCYPLLRLCVRSSAIRRGTATLSSPSPG